MNRLQVIVTTTLAAFIGAATGILSALYLIYVLPV